MKEQIEVNLEELEALSVRIRFRFRTAPAVEYNAPTGRVMWGAHAN